MGTVINISNQNATTFSDGYDALVVRENYTAVDGGVPLDVTGFTKPNIRAGHVIIRTGAAGAYVYKPMPLDAAGTAYAALPADHEYYGHAVNSVLTTRAFVGVTYHAKINYLVVDPAAGVYDLAPILDALKAELTHVLYKGDKE